jgi:hypothetical protein
MPRMTERDIVRDLGRRTHALAVSAEYEARRRRWRDVNALRRPDRPPVWCKPVDCWQELLRAGEIRCADPGAVRPRRVRLLREPDPQDRRRALDRRYGQA